MNSRQIGVLMLATYLILSAEFILFILQAWGLKINTLEGRIIIACWIGFCVGSVPFQASFQLFRYAKTRKPTLKEQVLLNELFKEVQERSKSRKNVRLLVIEDKGNEAFAIGARTIAISKGLLDGFEKDEVRGVMAHELGHLESWDSWISTAYSTAASPSVKIFSIAEWVYRKIPRLRRTFQIAFIIWFLKFVYSDLRYDHYWKYVILPLFYFIYPKVHKAIHFCWNTIARYREYRQDAFANSLGYGNAMLTALHKLTISGESEVNLFKVITTHSHPVMHNRIRRLEKLNGLRT